MRLPHELLWHKSGMWHFRIIVPRDLLDALGKKVIKRSLGTREPGLAKAYAYAVGAQYARAIVEAKEALRMGNGRVTSPSSDSAKHADKRARPIKRTQHAFPLRRTRPPRSLRVR